MEPEITPVIKDFYLSLPSEADMPTVLSAFYDPNMTIDVDPETGEETVTINGDPFLVPYTPDYALDVVGLIYKPTGNMLTDSEGNEYPETAPVAGWHVNIRLVTDAMREVVEGLNATYGANPVTPERVWA